MSGNIAMVRNGAKLTENLQQMHLKTLEIALFKPQQALYMH